jgi:hypothetical protein
VSNRDVRDLTLFNFDLQRRNCPAARYPSAAHAVSRISGMFNGRSDLIKDLLDVITFTK